MSNLVKSVGYLSIQTRTLIAALLNPATIFRNDNNLPRDWRGLAQLCNIGGEFVGILQQCADPTSKILDMWLEKDVEYSTIENLLKYLEELDRYDIIEDSKHLIEDDMQKARTYVSLPIKSNPISLVSDRYILTQDDVNRINEGLEPQLYDAFVLFADDDIDFATELIDTMEKQYKMRFCVKERDLMCGAMECDAITQLITDRCNRLIVILSESFFSSAANNFFLSFAQSVGMEQRQRKVIPCVYKKVEMLPPTLTCFHLLDHRRSGSLWNFWDKLRDSITAPSTNDSEIFLLKRKIEQTVTPKIHFSNKMEMISSSMGDLNKTPEMSETRQTRPSLPLNLQNGVTELKKSKSSPTRWLRRILHKSGSLSSNYHNSESVPELTSELQHCTRKKKSKKLFWNRKKTNDNAAKAV